jgi:hypothetical protein
VLRHDIDLSTISACRAMNCVPRSLDADVGVTYRGELPEAAVRLAHGLKKEATTMTTADEAKKPPTSIPAQADEAAAPPSHPQPDAHVVSVVELIRKRFSIGT